LIDLRVGLFYSLVSKTSRITLKTLDHSVLLRKSNLIGESTFNLVDILRQHNGKLSNVELHVDLKNDGAKVGTLVVKLNGLRFDMGNTSGSAGPVQLVIPPANPLAVAPECTDPSISAPESGISVSSNGISSPANELQNGEVPTEISPPPVALANGGGESSSPSINTNVKR